MLSRHVRQKGNVIAGKLVPDAILVETVDRHAIDIVLVFTTSLNLTLSQNNVSAEIYYDLYMHVDVGSFIVNAT